MKFALATIAILLFAGLLLADGCGTPSYSYPYRHSSYVVPSYTAPAYTPPVKKVYHAEYAEKLLLVLPIIRLSTTGASYVEPQVQQPQALQNPQQPSAPSQSQQPQAQTSQMQQMDAKLNQLLEGLSKLNQKVDQIQQRVDRLERVRDIPAPKTERPEQAPPPKEEADPAVAFKASNAASCAMCHSRSNAARHGGSFVYTEDDGTMVRLTADQREEVERQISSDGKTPPRMPKLSGKRAEETKPAPLTGETYAAHLKMMDKQKFTVKR